MPDSPEPSPLMGSLIVLAAAFCYDDITKAFRLRMRDFPWPAAGAAKDKGGQRE